MRLILLLMLVLNPICAWAQLNADSLRAEWNNKKQTDSVNKLVNERKQQDKHYKEYMKQFHSDKK